MSPVEPTNSVEGLTERFTMKTPKEKMSESTGRKIKVEEKIVERKKIKK